MNLAFNQARKIQGNTGENPSVGVVIVKNGSVFRLAHTNFNGRPHAEQIALKGKENFKANGSSKFFKTTSWRRFSILF